MSDFARQVFEKLEMYHSNISSKLEEYEVNGSVLIGVMNNGRKVQYDSLRDNVRYLPDDPINMTDEEYKAEFAHRVRYAMLKEGINQLELANLSGVPQGVLSGYLSGKNMPSLSNIAKIATALHCSADEFIYKG